MRGLGPDSQESYSTGMQKGTRMAATSSGTASTTPLQIEQGTLLAFFVLVVIGGSNAVAVRFSNLELPPFWGAAMRFLGAAAIYWVIVLIRRTPLPGGRALLGNVIYGLLTVGLSYAFLYWGILKISASMTMVIMATGPLLTLLFATAHRLEKFRWGGLLGALVALGGIILAVSQDLGRSIPLLSLLSVLAGAACIAEGTVLFKGFPHPDPLATNAVGTACGAIFLVMVSLLAGESWSLPTSSSTWIAYAYLVVAGSVVLFYLYLFVLSRWTASATSYSFLLFPVATVVIAAWLTDESITPRFLLGGLIVLLGVWLGAFRQNRPPTAEEVPCPEAGTAVDAPIQPGCA